MSFFSKKLNIYVSTQGGLEAVLKREMTTLGFLCGGAESGRVPFEGTIKDVASANMFLRTASKVFVLISKFKSESFDDLFEGVLDIPWEDILPKGLGVNVIAKSVKSTLTALSSIQSVSKKAIAVRFSKFRGVGKIPESKDNMTVEISILENIVSVFFDTTGESLHKRGYRTLVGRAPLRETLAAGIIMLSFWKPDRVLWDPFVGSGTIPIEAALIGTNTAPGINRSFQFESLPGGKNLLQEVKEHASSLILDVPLRIYGNDIDKRSIDLSLNHAKLAGVEKYIHFQKSDMRTFSSRFAHGIIVTNPPYGERLANEGLDDLYQDLYNKYLSLDKWSMFILSAYKNTEKSMGKYADKTRKLFNSELECKLLQYFGPPPAKRKVPTAEDA